jgi:glycerol transport system ATP-binding protein
MGLSLQNIDKVVGRETHLKDINLALEPGSRNVLLGRTQAGKTSLLRIMAGIDRPTKGKILIDDRNVTRVSVRKRSVAMVYQQFINYPSLTVFKNIASPLKVSGVPRAEIDRRVRETAAMLHLEDLLDRLPAELSGGQQQRIAIARALVKEAQLLLLDEPLVNLDYKLREELRMELQEIFEAGRGADAGGQNCRYRRRPGTSDRPNTRRLSQSHEHQSRRSIQRPAHKLPFRFHSGTNGQPG